MSADQGAIPLEVVWSETGREVINVVVIAPALALRAGLRALLAADQGIAVIVEAASLTDLNILPATTDVIVLAGSAEIGGELAQLLPGAEAVALLLIVEDAPGATRLPLQLPLRAWGILPLEASAEELSAAVRALSQGLLVGTPSLLKPLFIGHTGEGGTDSEPLVEPLTERESEVLQLLAQGLANKQIATALSISEHTVKFHVSAIYTKFGATNRTEAVRMGVRKGLVVL